MLRRNRQPHPTHDDGRPLVSYGGYTIRASVCQIGDGEAFGGTWVIAYCSFGRSTPMGYEVRFLLGDNDHYATRGEAIDVARRRARQTIDRREVDALHLSLEEAVPLRSRR